VFSWCFYFSPIIQFKKANGSVDYSNVFGKFDFNKLVLLDIYGNRIPPSFFNDKVIVLDYWFIGCAPCYSKIKELWKVQEYFKSDSSIQIFAVNNGNDDSFSSFVQECERRKFDDFSLYDKGGYFSKKYSVQAFPFEIIIKNGTIVSTSIGFNEDMKLLYTKKLIDQIKHLK
jgi:thiol-disulfide isomerase/thioredoxin